ncbi:unnamed protein product [Candida verbasci]|uniref:methylated diphthine methylhydrolase n=1 Tax=Candida verbasci TaxID=1227364 RepID=A0A9W4TVK9_9ASCO|nr:unnamed protein product [Candida verbasci]
MSGSISNSLRFATITTNLPPCCLRIYARDTSKIFIGTYKLEDSGHKHGSLDLYTYKNEKLEMVASIATSSAILDLKLHPRDPNLLITSHSNGHIMIWKYLEDEDRIELKDDITIDEETLITSIFFNPTQNSILLTYTNGYSSIFNLDTFINEYLDSFHDLECWTGSFGEINELQNVVFTGGDDSKLIARDLRSNSEIWSLKRGHEAGIVSILAPNQNWNSQMSNNLLTGSYDDKLRILDLRSVDNNELISGIIPRTNYTENLGGGVWRLIPSPVDNRLLTCCMYDGARIIDNITENSFVVSRYFKKDHQSMCYGGDWSIDGQFIATCSFYDKTVQIWSPNDIE